MILIKKSIFKKKNICKKINEKLNYLMSIFAKNHNFD